LTSYPDQLLATDNKSILTDKQDILIRWAAHFQTLLNDTTVADEEVANQITQSPINTELDACPSLSEVKDAIGTLCEGKSPGADGLHPEIIKRGGNKLAEVLHNIITEAWNQSEVSQDWKDALLITIFKKGDRKICGNYRGMSLLSIPRKCLSGSYSTGQQVLLKAFFRKLNVVLEQEGEQQT